MRLGVRFSVLSLCLLAAAAASPQAGWSRYRVQVTNAYEADVLSNSSLGLFSEQVAMPSTDVVVGPGELPALTMLGLQYRYVSELPDPRNWAETYGNQDADYRNNYLRYDDIIAQYEAWRAQYPTLMTRTQIGNSIQGRPMYAYRICADFGGTKARKTVVIAGGTHAREWISPSVTMHITERLLNGAGADPLVSSILRHTAVHIVPSLNPDGYEYCWTNNRMWRKNRRNNGSSFGVDLNRNYSVGWGGEGSSSSPSSDVYRGTAPFSEPELQNLRNYVLNKPGLKGFIDWHSFAEKILYVWSYTESPAPAAAWHNQVGVAMKNAMVAAGGHAYTVGQGSIALYIAGGTSKDWFYSQFGATSFTVEVRDTGQDGFLLPESQIIPTQDECWAGFKQFLSMVHTQP